MPSIWLQRFQQVVLNSHFWVILLLLGFITISYYPEKIGLATTLLPNSLLGLTRHTIARMSYLVPIIYSGYFLGPACGLAITGVALALMVPQAILVSPGTADALFETGIVVLAGIFANVWFKARAKQLENAVQREQAIASMTAMQEKLRAQIRNTMKREKELIALSRLSSSLSESLEMDQLLRSAIDMVMEILGVEIVLIFTLDEETEELVTIAYEGIAPDFAKSVDRMKVGEGFNGRVAETGEPLIVEDASSDPRLTRHAVRQEKLQAQLIVPMKARNRVIGTVCVAMRQQRTFTVEEIELLTAMASEIGIAIENARLHQEQLQIAERLGQSEKHYRELFESAHDAIWLHDLDGNILSANKAAETLSGYSLEELSQINVRDLLSPEDLQTARETGRGLLSGKVMSQPYEQRLIRKNGTQATIRLTTNLISHDGQPQSFQNIARDITEEKRMQENLHSYVQQITRAQEEERLRIARELHDSTAQNLIVLIHRLESFLHDQAKLPIDKVRELWSFHEQIKDILQEIRGLSRDLRPSILDDVGLLPALQWIIRELKIESGIQASLQIDGTERRFPQEVELLLFRVVQEAIRNIGKHSQASKAEVLLRFGDKSTTITVTDDGKGFETPEKISDLSRSGKLGLVGMEERVRLLGGSLEVKSRVGKGTSVVVEIRI